MFWLSVALVIGANIFYHSSQKLIPSAANPFVSLFVTFLTAATAALILIPIGIGNKPIVEEFKKLNWASVTVGLAIVGVDLGYLLAYRSGWRVSLGSTFCNAWIALLMLPVGVMLFKEKLVPANYLGVILALAGVFLISRN